jgi:hypothetical protein
MQFNSLRTGFFLFLLFIVACFKTEAATAESLQVLINQQIHQGNPHEEHLMFLAEEITTSEDRDDDDDRKRLGADHEVARLHERLDSLCRFAEFQANNFSAPIGSQGAVPLRIRFGVFRI